VKTQIGIALSVSVLVALVKKQLPLERSLTTILQILSVSLFEKTPISQVFSNAEYKDLDEQSDNQLNLFSQRWDSSDNQCSLTRSTRMGNFLSTKLSLPQAFSMTQEQR